VLVVISDTTAEAEVARRALAAAAHLVGPSAVPRVVVAAIGGQSLDALLAVVDHRPMTHAEVADVLDVSTRTVRRLVARGELRRVGRRIAAESVVEFARRRR
jgi:excisionase family DNA binding protein